MTGTWNRIRRQRVLYLFILPGLVLIFLFNYLPMYGVIIAFSSARRSSTSASRSTTPCRSTSASRFFWKR